MEDPRQLAPFVGFTETEVKELCAKYDMDFAECRAWYDGYCFPEAAHIYSPKSIVEVMLSHRYDAYWNSTETYKALKVYIDLNEAGLRDAIVQMMGGASIPIDTTTFQNDHDTPRASRLPRL